jgi:hypothetical protein
VVDTVLPTAHASVAERARTFIKVLSCVKPGLGLSIMPHPVVQVAVGVVETLGIGVWVAVADGVAQEPT